MPSLEYRRIRADVIQVYKILTNIDTVKIDPHFRIPYLSVFPYFFHIFSMEFSWKKIRRKISQHGHKENMRTAYGLYREIRSKSVSDKENIRKVKSLYGMSRT